MSTPPHRGDGDDRHETADEKLDRNWNDMLQELRVIQTGVQFLTGFLLTLPFQQRFATLSHDQRAVYLVTAACSITATAFLQAPVSVHRALFRRHEKGTTVLTAHRLALVGLVFLAAAVVGVAYIIFSVLEGRTAGIVTAVLAALLLLVLWLVVPRALRGHPEDTDHSHHTNDTQEDRS